MGDGVGRGGGALNTGAPGVCVNVVLTEIGGACGVACAAGGAGLVQTSTGVTIGGGAFFVGNGIAGGAGLHLGGGAGAAGRHQWHLIAKCFVFPTSHPHGNPGPDPRQPCTGHPVHSHAITGQGGGAAFSGGDPPMAGAWFLEGVGGEAPDGVGVVGSQHRFGGGDFAVGRAGSDPSGADIPAPMANEKVHLLPLPSRTWWSGDLSSHSLRVPRSNKRFSSPIHIPVPAVRLLGSKLNMPRLA